MGEPYKNTEVIYSISRLRLRLSSSSYIFYVKFPKLTHVFEKKLEYKLPELRILFEKKLKYKFPELTSLLETAAGYGSAFFSSSYIFYVKLPCVGAKTRSSYTISR